MKLVVDSILIEQIVYHVSYEDLVDIYEYTQEEIEEAVAYIDNALPDDILMRLEEAAVLHEDFGW